VLPCHWYVSKYLPRRSSTNMKYAHMEKCYHTYKVFSPNIFTQGFQRNRKQEHLGPCHCYPWHTCAWQLLIRITQNSEFTVLIRWREFNSFRLLPRIGFGIEERAVLSAPCSATVVGVVTGHFQLWETETRVRAYVRMYACTTYLCIH